MICLTLQYFTGYAVYAQPAIVAKLDLGKNEPRPEFYEYSPTDGGIITLGPASAASSRYIGIVKYNAKLEKEWAKRVLEQNGRKTIDFVSVVGRFIFVFVSEFIPSDGLIKTYYYQYDVQGNPIAEESIISIYPNQKEQKTLLQYVLSPNKRKLLCYKNLDTRKEGEQLLYYIFDDEGDYVQNGEISLKYPDNKFRIRSMRISNEGNIFFLGKFSPTTLVREADDVKYLVFRYELLNQQVREIPIELGDRFITDLAFRLDRDENMYVAGFYSNRGNQQLRGTLLQKIDRDGKLIVDAIDEFNEDFLSRYLSKGQIERGKELQNFFLNPDDGIVLRSDGGVLLIAEKFYLTYQTYRDIYGFFSERKVYHYEDIILTSVSGDGRIEWHSIVEKEQVSLSPATLSFFGAVGQEGAIVFYEYQPRKGNFNIYYNTVDFEGQVKLPQGLVADYRLGNEFYPRFCEQINNNEAIIVYFQGRGKRLAIAKVRLG